MPSPPEYFRQRRSVLLLTGFCVICGKANARALKRTCQSCQDAKSAWVKARNAADRRAHRCIDCHQPHSRAPRLRCAACAEKRRIGERVRAEKRRQHAKAARQKRRALGVCERCGRVPVKRFRLCFFCREETNAARQERRRRTLRKAA